MSSIAPNLKISRSILANSANATNQNQIFALQDSNFETLLNLSSILKSREAKEARNGHLRRVHPYWIQMRSDKSQEQNLHEAKANLFFPA